MTCRTKIGNAKASADTGTACSQFSCSEGVFEVDVPGKYVMIAANNDFLDILAITRDPYRITIVLLVKYILHVGEIAVATVERLNVY